MAGQEELFQPPFARVDALLRAGTLENISRPAVREAWTVCCDELAGAMMAASGV
jgi:hypothetical protein